MDESEADGDGVVRPRPVPKLSPSSSGESAANHSTCFSTCSGTLNRWNSGKIYAKTANFFAEIRENSVNGVVFNLPYKQGVAGSSPAAPMM